ncbi:hypothetical protein EYF80_054048 [Liparis tanakae]|uniref:Uncharacterized protein n=1 Tax=Liparis tanakae TaxID=230148 RepID=A0A4Z2F4X9_9TELE|nr:hypothetical protein EYF80_054048 [Liparis tanakae]
MAEVEDAVRAPAPTWCGGGGVTFYRRTNYIHEMSCAEMGSHLYSRMCCAGRSGRPPLRALRRHHAGDSEDDSRGPLVICVSRSFFFFFFSFSFLPVGHQHLEDVHIPGGVITDGALSRSGRAACSHASSIRPTMPRGVHPSPERSDSRTVETFLSSVERRRTPSLARSDRRRS